MRSAQILATTLVCVAVFFAGGWYVGNGQQHLKTAEAIEAGLATSESHERLEAARAARAIQSLSSGDTNEATRLLAGAVADFYVSNTDRTSTNEQTAKVLTLIENLARTNRIVADRIAELKTNTEWRPSVRKASK
jgi:hypothetical protein